MINLAQALPTALPCRQFGQPFIDHNQHIKGIAQPVLLDYSVMPVVTNMLPTMLRQRQSHCQSFRGRIVGEKSAKQVG